MSTKLNNLAGCAIPAGLLEGIEAFWHFGQKWIIIKGHVTAFDDAPTKVQNMVANCFLKDKKSQQYLRKKGIVKFSEGFDRWYRCKIGGLDTTPDFYNGVFTPDAYNNSCTDYLCPDRGKFCSQGCGLKSHEVATLVALKAGKNLAQTAAQLCISTAAMKSRLEKIKEKLNATNMASLMAKSAEIGII